MEHGSRSGALALLGARPVAEERAGPANALRLGLVAVATALALAASFGASLGGTEPLRVLERAAEVPATVLVATALSAPAGWLGWRLARVDEPPIVLWLSVATGVLTGSAVLACGSPFLLVQGLDRGLPDPFVARAIGSIAVVLGGAEAFRALRSRTESPAAVAVLSLQIGTLLALLLELLEAVR